MKGLSLVYVIQCYEQRTDTGQLMDSVVVELVADSYKEAEKRARKLVKKKHYRLAQVIEKRV